MKFSILLFLANIGSTLGQNQKHTASNLRQTESERKINEECDAGIGKHLANIGDNAWNESEFSAKDYDEAKGLIELVKKNLRKNADSVEEGEKAVDNLDERFILTELFPNINQDPSEQDQTDNATGSERLLSINSEDEIEQFMTEFDFHVSNFPYDEALEKSKELDSINMREIYKQEGVTIENKESTINVHSVATFLEEKGVISAKDASIAKDFYLSRDELHRSLSECSEKLIQFLASYLMLILAIFQVPTKAVSKAASTLARKAMEKIAIEEAAGLALGMATGLTVGAVANFVDKVICHTLTAGQILGAIKDAITDWWTWLWFGIELAATVAAFFLTGGWYLAAKLVSLLVAAGSAIKAAIDAGKACNAKAIIVPDNVNVVGTFFIRSIHGTYLRIWPNNKVDMTTKKDAWEKITIKSLGRNRYALKSAVHGERYLKVNGRGASKTVDTQTFVGRWERFNIEWKGNGKVAFKSVHWGNYLRAQPGNNARVDTQTFVGSWEQFNLIAPLDGTYYIRSHHGNYIRIRPNNKVDMTTDKRDWEKITIKSLGNNQYALKSAVHGERYIKVNGGGAYKTISTQTRVGEWETFYIVEKDNGKVAFKSAHWGNYLRAEPGNNAKLNTQTGLRSWEQFNLESV